MKNKALYPVVIEKIKENALLNQLTFKELTESPILGGDGNKEFLAWFCRS